MRELVVFGIIVIIATSWIDPSYGGDGDEQDRDSDKDSHGHWIEARREPWR